MAQPPPRPAASRQGGPASSGANTASASGARAKEVEKPQPATYFLGRYRVVDEIGVGGMASVHLARMDGPGGFQKWVAIKRIHPHLVEDEPFVNMFLDEARIAARISHPNVAHGLRPRQARGHLLDRHGVPPRRAAPRGDAAHRGARAAHAARRSPCRVIADAAEGLHAAHELLGKNGEKLGLVHRDVTPHNLFVTYDGYTKVVDFGIAKFQTRACRSTRAGTLKGKLAYMSPEQVRGEPTSIGRTDIFALGVVLWELTTGQRLFRMDSDLDTLAKVQECNVPPPEHHRARLPDRAREDRDEGAREAQATSASRPRASSRARSSRSSCGAGSSSPATRWRRTSRRSSPTASRSARRTWRGRPRSPRPSTSTSSALARVPPSRRPLGRSRPGLRSPLLRRLHQRPSLPNPRRLPRRPRAARPTTAARAGAR